MESLWNIGPNPHGVLLSLGTGAAVCLAVFLGMLYVSRRSRVSMLDLLLLRRSGWRPPLPPEEGVPDAVVTSEAIRYLKTPMEDLAYLNRGAERRTGARKWGNPVEVQVQKPDCAIPLRGVVINRSAGGLAILVDDAYPPAMELMVRAIQAPTGVGWITVQVKNCRAAGKNWVIGCSYPETPSWNAVVWLG